MKSPSNRSRRKKISQEKFGERELVKTVWKTMADQAKKNPHLRHLHERLSPEFEQVTGLIRKFLSAAQESEDPILQEIFRFKEKALLPLVDFIRGLKKTSGK